MYRTTSTMNSGLPSVLANTSGGSSAGTGIGAKRSLQILANVVGSEQADRHLIEVPRSDQLGSQPRKRIVRDEHVAQPVGHDDEQTNAGEAWSEVRQHVNRRRVRPVKVLDEDER